MFNLKRKHKYDFSSENDVEDIEEDAEVSLLPETLKLIDLSVQYQQMLFFYEAGIQQLTAKLQILNREFQCFYERNPIENIKSRVKAPESIIAKMQKKGLPLTTNCMLDNIYDIAGVRVICSFVSDVYQIARMLMNQSDIELIRQKDYIRYPKENGYRSLHLVVKVTVNFAEQERQVPVEIQLRTIAMDFWASTDHQLRYKKNLEFTDQMQEQLLECAKAMEKADKQMQELANIVMKA